MSIDNIKPFFDKAKADLELRHRITEIFRDPSTAQPEALARLSEQSGTPFTAQELLDHASQTRLLGDAELEHISGGAGGANYEKIWAQDVAAMSDYHARRP